MTEQLTFFFSETSSEQIYAPPIPTREVSARLILKSVGGKRSILPELIARLPASYESYHEPFMGGAALFFAAKPKWAFLSDINANLVTTYQTIRDEQEKVLARLKTHADRHSKEHYLQSRKKLRDEPDSAKRAALLIYLNKTCYNGLYRVNRSGEFNVPMGRYATPSILDETNLRNVSITLQNTEITHDCFSKSRPGKESFYYLDPPYHQTYDGYNSGGFKEDDHRRLAGFCHTIHKAGGHFMLSNSNTDFIRQLYKPYHIEQVMAARMVSCKAGDRARANELIIRNYT